MHRGEAGLGQAGVHHAPESLGLTRDVFSQSAALASAYRVRVSGAVAHDARSSSHSTMLCAVFSFPPLAGPATRLNSEQKERQGVVSPLPAAYHLAVLTSSTVASILCTRHCCPCTVQRQRPSAVSPARARVGCSTVSQRVGCGASGLEGLRSARPRESQ